MKAPESCPLSDCYSRLRAIKRIELTLRSSCQQEPEPTASFEVTFDLLRSPQYCSGQSKIERALGVRRCPPRAFLIRCLRLGTPTPELGARMIFYSLSFLRKETPSRLEGRSGIQRRSRSVP